MKDLFPNMMISSAVFDRSADDLDSCPEPTLPEVAFVGRSNVGKSSLLNLLTRNGGLARVSPTPGHTRTINFFTINDSWRLVDLPGYGFAEVAREGRTQFSAAVTGYIAGRENLAGICALIDSRLPPQDIDLEFIDWLAGIEAPFVLVFTKTDKCSPAQVRGNIEAFQERISPWFETLPRSFTCSAVARVGREELLRFIGSILPPRPQKMNRKPAPRRNTPW